MDRRSWLSIALGLGCLAAAQAQRRPHRVGFLATGSLSATPTVLTALKDSLAALGWAEGIGVEYIVLAADGHVDRLDTLARQLVEARADVIVAGPPSSVAAAMRATRTIPVVMGNVPDPVGLGMVRSLAHPGGNVTGVSSQTISLVAKELEFLRQLLPRLRRVGLLFSELNPTAAAFRVAAAQAAQRLELTIVESVASQPGEIPTAVQRMQRMDAEAVAVPADPMMLGARAPLNELLTRARLPGAFGNREHAFDGGLLSYSPDIVQNFRVAARFVDRILRGADPGQLAVEQSDKIELVVNLRAARTLGITVPQSVLLRADHVVA